MLNIRDIMLDKFLKARNTCQKFLLMRVALDYKILFMITLRIQTQIRLVLPIVNMS